MIGSSSMIKILVASSWAMSGAAFEQPGHAIRVEAHDRGCLRNGKAFDRPEKESLTRPRRQRREIVLEGRRIGRMDIRFAQMR